MADIFQAEEVKLVSQLAEMDAINYWLFKHAYNTSMDVSNQLSHYEMSKLLTGPYDKEGACIMIKSAPGSKDSEVCIYYYRKICFLVDG